MAASLMPPAVTSFDEWSDACCTDIKVERLNFTWTIKRFEICMNTCDLLRSSTFSPGNNKALKWHLLMQTQLLHGRISLYLFQDPAYKPHVSFDFSVSILNEKKEECLKRCLRYKGGPAAGVGFDDFASKSFILDPANGLLQQGSLTISCHMTVFYDPVTVAGQLDMPKCTLPEEFNELLANPKFSDITLVSSEGREIKAHKGILSARCVVFSAMLDHSMVESETSRVKIDDIQHEVLTEMLRYIYTGATDFKPELARDLLKAADKYVLKRLKAKCEDVLCQDLSAENAAEFLLLADRHSASYLKSQVMEFINAHSSEIVGTVGFLNMMKSYPELMVDVFRGRGAGEPPPKKRFKNLYFSGV